jgi:1-aminocyclopropane-1-carboxylate deaminase
LTTCTGSTQAVMVVGFAAQDRRRRVIGIDTAELIAARGGPRVTIRDEDIEINPDYSGPAYGLPSEPTSPGYAWRPRLEAMITDPVYEGKSVAGMIDLCRQGAFKKGERVLYVHLGGAPAINAYYKAFEDSSNLTKLAREARYQE